MQSLVVPLTVSSANASFIGENAGDLAGNALNGVGDVNNDGIDDFAIGSRGFGSNTGKAYLIIGKDSGWDLDQSLSTFADVSFTGENAGDEAGVSISVNGTGDVDNDTIDDFAIGAHYNDYGGISNRGQSYLVRGKNAGWADVNLANVDASFYGEAAGDRAGEHTAAIGDVNGDGFDDYLTGVSFNDAGGADAGQVYLIFGRPTGNWAMHSPITDAGASYIGATAGDRCGYRLAGVGDVNNGGLPDFAIGCSGFNSFTGKVYLIFGEGGTWAMDTQLSLDSSHDASFIGEGSGDRSGVWINGLGNINGDLYDDFAIGAPNNDNGSGVDAGKVYIILGKASGWTKNTSLSNADIIFQGEGAGDYAGRRIDGIDDINGDNIDDFAIGAPDNDNNGFTNNGRTYMYFGRASWANQIQLSLSTADLVFQGENDNDRNGTTNAGLGDINDDGLGDFAIGAPFNDDAGSDAGKIYLFLSPLLNNEAYQLQVGSGLGLSDYLDTGYQTQTSGTWTITGTTVSYTMSNVTENLDYWSQVRVQNPGVCSESPWAYEHLFADCIFDPWPQSVGGVIHAESQVLIDIPGVNNYLSVERSDPTFQSDIGLTDSTGKIDLDGVGSCQAGQSCWPHSPPATNSWWFEDGLTSGIRYAGSWKYTYDFYSQALNAPLATVLTDCLATDFSTFTDDIYRVTGDCNVDLVQNITGNQHLILFVENNLIIEREISIDPGSSLAFIVQGHIYVNEDLDQDGDSDTPDDIAGIFLAGSSTSQFFSLNTSPATAGYGDISNYDALIQLRYNTSYQALGQGMKVSQNSSIDSVSLYLQKLGNPSDNIWAEIHTDNGGLPSDTVVTNGTSQTIAANSISTSISWYTFTFSTPPVLTAGTQYHLVLQGDYPINNFDLIRWGADLLPSPGYADGDSEHKEAAGWTLSPSFDHIFSYISSSSDPNPQLVVDGQVVAYGGVVLDRDRGSANLTEPAEIFQLRPDFLIIPQYLSIQPDQVYWRQTPP
jgi:hypothetical protein